MLRNIYAMMFRVVGRKTPESMRWLRNFLVRKYVKSAGKNINIGRMCKIHKNTIIGSDSGVGYGCEIPDGVVIGDSVMMGPEVIFFTNNHNTKRTDIPMRQQGMTPKRPIIIEDDVWIGARACILPGVTVGKGAVIGACAVVSKDVPAYAVAVGNPARVVKYRGNIEN